MKKISTVELGQYLDENNIITRYGQHCLHKSKDLQDSIRISLQFYNTKKDIDRLLGLIREFEI